MFSNGTKCRKVTFFRTFSNIVCSFLEYEGVESQIFSRNITNFLSILAPEILMIIDFLNHFAFSARVKTSFIRNHENCSEITEIRGIYFCVFGRHAHWKDKDRRRRAGSQMTRRVTKGKAILKFYTRLDAISLHEKAKSFTFYRHFKWHISFKLSLLAHLLSPKYYRYTNIYISPSYTGTNLTNNFNRKKTIYYKIVKKCIPSAHLWPVERLSSRL